MKMGTWVDAAVLSALLLYDAVQRASAQFIRFGDSSSENKVVFSTDLCATF